MRHGGSLLAVNEAASLPWHPGLLPGGAKPMRRSCLHLRVPISTKRPEPHGKAGSIDRRPTRLDPEEASNEEVAMCRLWPDLRRKDGWPDDGIAPGTLWQDVPEDWLCPDCGVGKMDFEMIEIG